MHELALIEEVCRLAQEAAAGQGAHQIHRLHVRVGDLCGVDPDALRQAFAVVQDQAGWATVELDLEIVPTRCWCPDCGEAFLPSDVIHACPRCGQLSRMVLSGRELTLVGLEVS